MSKAELRAIQREHAVKDAAGKHEQHFTVLRELEGILRARVREPYEWNAVWDSRAPYSSVQFLAPSRNWSEAEVKRRVASALPLWRWAILCVLAAATAATLGGMVQRLAAAALLAATAVAAVLTLRARLRCLRGHLEKLEAECQEDLKTLRIVHDQQERAAHDAWLAEDQLRERVRTAVDRDDCEALAFVLEHELQNESLPFPYSFEIEMDNVSTMTIRLALPDLDVVPEQRTALTKTGKLSLRAMAQRDRVALYIDVCTGLALRLAYEAFRVLPSLADLTVFGHHTRPDPFTGHNADVTALHIRTGRQGMAALNLDGLDPSSAIAALGGKFACNRRGELSNLVQ